jgi:hypothetical protein
MTFHPLLNLRFCTTQERLDLEKLRQASIVGMTTTGAAKCQGLLAQLGVKVHIYIISI